MRPRTWLLLLLGCLGYSGLCAAPQPMDGKLLVNGAQLHVQVIGRGAPILFLHGGLQYFDNAFAKLRGAFVDDHMLIGIDQRGHGRSPDVPGALSYQSMADDTAAVLEKLGVGPVDVIGHSDGGNVALLLARDHPALVRRLVISGANIRSGLSNEEFQQRLHWSREELNAKVNQLSAQIPPGFQRDYAAVSPDGAAHFAVLLEKSIVLWSTPVVMPAADLKRVAAPVLVVAGDHDFTSIEDTAEIYRGLPHGQLLILPGVGHGTWEVTPELPTLAIRRFLQAP